jgi:cephalosporin hydroxylase
VDDRAEFEAECRARARAMADDPALRERSADWQRAAHAHRYTYNFRWLGLPIIQFPQDLVALQEIVWSTRPELIVETGVARGGSVVFYASLLEMIGGPGRVMAIDVDLREHNRRALEEHPLAGRIDLVDGSSLDPGVVARAAAAAREAASVLVVLDSSHAHDHVLGELRAYGPLVTPGSHLVVLDTFIEQMPDDAYPDRPWGRGDNAATAVQAYLTETERFSVDADLEAKLLISEAPGGYLRCVAPRP